MKLNKNVEVNAIIKDLTLSIRNEYVLRNKIRILPYKVKCYKKQPYDVNTIYRSCRALNYLLSRK